MKVSTYDWIWDQINKSILEIEDSMSQLVLPGGVRAIDELHFRRTYGSATKEEVKDEYIRIRDQLKHQCYADANDENGALNRIDHHKIAACFCKALLKKKVFAFDLRDETPPKMILSNYELAYTVSLRIIYIYLIEAYRNEKQFEFADTLIQGCTLQVPETSSSHDRYNDGRIKTLALNDYYGMELDILTYADMMYWIEYYNKQIIEGRIILKVCGN